VGQGAFYPGSTLQAAALQIRYSEVHEVVDIGSQA